MSSNQYGKATNWRGASKQLKLMSEREFFLSIANKTGFIDAAFIKKIYNSMIDTVYEEIRDRGAIRLPQLLDLYLKKSPARSVYKPLTKTIGSKPVTYYVKPKMVASVKIYFREQQKNNPGLLKGPEDRVMEQGLKISPRGPWVKIKRDKEKEKQ